MLVTLLTFQELMFPLNAVATWNMEFMFVTLLTVHELRF
jgi:hypothetical protein